MRNLPVKGQSSFRNRSTVPTFALLSAVSLEFAHQIIAVLRYQVIALASAQKNMKVLDPPVDPETGEPPAEAPMVDTSRVYLGAISPWGEDNSQDFCVDGGVAAGRDEDGDITKAYFSDDSGRFTWDDRNVVWFYRDPSNSCDWTYHCKYSSNLGTANYGQSLDRCTSDTCLTLQTTMRLLLDESAKCAVGNAASGAAVPSLAAAALSLLAAVAWR